MSQQASEQASGRANGPALYALISCNFYLEYSGGGLAVVVAVAMASRYYLSQKYITIFSNTILEKKIARPHVFVYTLTQKLLPKVSKLNLHFKQAFEASIIASVGLSIG